jgi:GTP-binding protein
MFVDEVTITVRAGSGGSGSAAMLREPYKPRGGPEGGDGGPGGNVLLRVEPSLFDLASYADRPHHRAGHGGAGGRSKRHGASGKDLVLPVPEGTLVWDDQGLVADLVGAGTTLVAARGGRGGRGNASLASPRNRAPRTAERGEQGEEKRLRLELRLVADAALVGAPNAGKSTLLARLTAARPKIADYPFTTLTPNLGVAGRDERFVVADVPGLVQGAHQGKGLGLTFLRHVSRSRVLLYTVDLSDQPLEVLSVIRAEVASFDPQLAARRALVVGTKADLVPDAQLPPGIDMAVSGLSGQGIDELEAMVRRLVMEARAEEPPPSPPVVLRPGREPFSVRQEGRRFRVSGPRVERWVADTDLEDERAVTALQRRLKRAGVERRLAQAGARRGDEIVIGESAFEFLPDAEPGPASPPRHTQDRGPEA